MEMKASAQTGYKKGESLLSFNAVVRWVVG